ncbi:unnamed protein product [Umbelopsis ramanniana]
MFALRTRLTPLYARGFATAAAETKKPAADKAYKVVVIGGGPGGLSVSSTVSKLLGQSQVAVIEPSKVHYYQPLWTYVGGGLKSFSEFERPMGELISPEADWIQDKVTKVNAEENTVTLADGKRIGYDYLVVAAGIQVNWDNIKGLKSALGKNGVTSNYSADSVQKTWQFIQEFKGGNALFTFPATPPKCPGAPTKITFLAEEAFRNLGVREKTNVIYNHAGAKIFGVDHYGKVLQRLADERGIQTNYFTELIEIKADDKEAIFRNNQTKDVKTFNYDMIHVAPPCGPPAFIKESNIGDAAGWVDVNKETTRHNKYSNIFALGDCSSLPTSKTAAAITAESGVLKHNLIADLEGKTVEPAKYDGYTSCPLIVGRKQLILAEFSGYTGTPMETFPVDQRQISLTAQFLNKEVIPEIYWRELLAGRWTGPSKYREAMAPFRGKYD